MNSLMEKLADFSRKNGVDVMGFAPKSRFEGVDPRHNPFTIFPEGETVIMIGKRICRGSLRGVEEGSNFGDYNLFGKDWLEDTFLSVTCYDLTRVLENDGWEAVPVFPNPSEMSPQGIPVEKGKPAPNIHPDFEYSAVAAGVAEIAFNGLLFTPEFGSRQRFHMVITDAALSPSPILERSVCDKCGKCADACPLNAISKEEFDIVEVCGKAMKVAKINYSLCKKCQNGAVENRLYAAGRPDRIAAACNRACLLHLEENGLVSNVFENRFRQNDAWALDVNGEYISEVK